MSEIRARNRTIQKSAKNHRERTRLLVRYVKVQKVMSPRNSSDDEHVTAVQRVATASIARRRNAQLAAQTPPFGSSDNSGEGMRPELALGMEQQAAMVARLEELERERMTLPSPTGKTFGPASSMESRVIVPATRPAATFRSPSMRMTHVRPMEVDDLHDVFGTESRVCNASVRTERRALPQLCGGT